MMKSKLRNNKTSKIDDKNRSALGETIKIKKGFNQKAKESSKRNAVHREKGHISWKWGTEVDIVTGKKIRVRWPSI
jgi:hypothetical protein